MAQMAQFGPIPFEWDENDSFTTKTYQDLPSLKLTAKAPKNGWLEYYFPIGEAYFQVRNVSFRKDNNHGDRKSPRVGGPLPNGPNSL